MKSFLVATAVLLCLQMSTLASGEVTSTKQEVAILSHEEKGPRVLVTEHKESKRGTSLHGLENTILENEKISNNAACTPSQRLQTGFKRSGNVIRSEQVPNAVSCVNTCAKAIQGCVAINFATIDDMNICDFLEDAGSISVSDQHTTALVNPYEESVCDSGNFVLYHDRPGQDLPNMPVPITSARGCCLFCYYTPGCVLFAYRPASGNCWLKGTFPEIKEDDDAIIGPVCSPATCA